MEWLYILIALVLVGALAFWFLRSRGADSPAPTAAPDAVPGAAPAAPAPPKGLRDRLSKTRQALSDRLGGVFGRASFDSDFWTDSE